MIVPHVYVLSHKADRQFEFIRTLIHFRFI